MTNIEYAKWIVFQDVESNEVSDSFIRDLINTLGFNQAIASLVLAQIGKMETEPDKITHGETSLSWTRKVNSMKEILYKAEKRMFNPPELENINNSVYNQSMGGINTK